MPEISRFFEIVIRMFTEPATQHQRPHFHPNHHDTAAVFAIDSAELLGGGLPRRQRRLVEAWAEIHREELMEDWRGLQAGPSPFRIEPLR